MRGGGRVGDFRADTREVDVRFASPSGGKEKLSLSDIVLLLVGRTKIVQKNKTIFFDHLASHF